MLEEILHAARNETLNDICTHAMMLWCGWLWKDACNAWMRSRKARKNAG